MDPNEEVLVVGVEGVDCVLGSSTFQGMLSHMTMKPHLLLSRLLQVPVAGYVRRGMCEEDRRYKQIIPYVLFRYADEDMDYWLEYTRPASAGEARLAGFRSVGIGGHINPTDDKKLRVDAFYAGMHREINEEVQCDTSFKTRVVGFLNDETTTVGQVHLGVVVVADVDRPCVYPKSEIQAVRFTPGWKFRHGINEVEYEGWSRQAIRSIIRAPRKLSWSD